MGEIAARLITETVSTKLTDLSGETNTAYWSVVAQVIPVLALALVIETRALARRWTTKKNFEKSKQARGLWAAILFVAILAMAWVFPAALLNIASGASSASEVAASVVVLAALSFIVASSPVNTILAIAAFDTLGPAMARLPWSRSARLVRRIDRLIEEVIDTQREARDLRIAILLALLQVEQMDIKMDQEDPADPEYGPSRERLAQSRQRFQEHLAKATQNLRRTDRALKKLAKYRAKASKVDLGTKQVTVIRKALREIAGA